MSGDIGKKRNLIKFNKGNAKICTWVRNNPIYQCWLGPTSWNTAFQRKS